MAEPEAPLHKPYVSPSESPRELTAKSVGVCALLGIVFAASSVYLALKVGLTVSASIPIAVLSITIFRFFGKLTERLFGTDTKSLPFFLRWFVGNATILENNIVQTAGSAGESIAAGVAFTLPSLL